MTVDSNRILIVEDEGIVAMDLQFTLEKLGHKVVGVVASGEEAVRKVTEDQPNLVLMDIRLKGKIDGIEAASQIQSKFDVPVIYLTAHADKSTLARAKVTEPFGYILKPFEERELSINIEIALYKHQMEQQLRNSMAELEKTRRLESLGLLAGGIAHDFNNLLTVILLNSELAQLKVETGAKEDILGYLGTVRETSLQARELTQYLLTFAQGGDPITRTVKLEDITQIAIQQILTNSPHLVVNSTVEPGLWKVEADEGQLGQVIHNLLLNASEVSSSAREIKIGIENFTFSPVEDEERISENIPLPPGNYVKLWVQDQGTNIPSEQLPHIFDPYYNTRQFGSGLALAISYSIIKNHNGYITVESKPEVGTTFSVYLPALVNKELVEPLVGSTSVPQSQPDTSAEEEQPNGRVLIMDDEIHLREILRDLLEYLNYEVEEARNGEEALELYQKAKTEGRRVDAVVLDLTIPNGMGGKETIKRLIEIDPEVQAIVSSGYSDELALTKYRVHGFKSKLPKPYSVKELEKALREVKTLR